VRQAVQHYQEQVRSELFVSREPAEQQEELEPVVTESSSWTPRPMPFSEPVSTIPPVQSHSPPATNVVESREPEVLQEKAVFKVAPPSESSPPTVELLEQETFTSLTLIGQLFDLYLLCEKDGQLLVIDQHAAHERIIYGRMRQAYLEHNIPAQILLFPVTVELGPDHCELFDRHQEAITQLGLQAEHFGESTYVIKAVPAIISQLAPADILTETLDALQNTGIKEGGGISSAIDSMFASMACKAAIKAGNRLQPREMLELLGQMEASKVFSHCPHGRPVIKSFSCSEIEKWFHRT
jgi:DNA mismatch repair protein MutL